MRLYSLIFTMVLMAICGPLNAQTDPAAEVDIVPLADPEVLTSHALTQKP